MTFRRMRRDNVVNQLYFQQIPHHIKTNENKNWKIIFINCKQKQEKDEGTEDNRKQMQQVASCTMCATIDKCMMKSMNKLKKSLLFSSIYVCILLSIVKWAKNNNNNNTNNKKQQQL